MHAKPVVMVLAAPAQQAEPANLDGQPSQRPAVGRPPVSRISTAWETLLQPASPLEGVPAGQSRCRFSSRRGSCDGDVSSPTSGRCSPVPGADLPRAALLSRPGSATVSRLCPPQAGGAADADSIDSQAILVAEAIAHFECKIQEGQGKQVSRCRSASPEVTLSASRTSQPPSCLELKEGSRRRASDTGEARPSRADEACDGQEQLSQAGKAASQAATSEAQPAWPQRSSDGDAEELAWVADFRRGIRLDGGGGAALQEATRKAAPGHACSSGGGALQAKGRGNALGLCAAAGRPARPSASAKGLRPGGEPDLERSPGGDGAAAVGRWGRKRHRGEPRWDAALAVPVEAKPLAAPDREVVPGLQQRAAMLAHQQALDRSALAFYGAAGGTGLQRDASCALRAANAALGHCHDTEPSVEVMWELKDAVYQLKCCMVGIMEQLESVLGAADSDSKQVQAELIEPICYRTTSQEVLQGAFLAQKAELARQDAEIARAAERIAEVERERRWSETLQRKDIARLVGVLQRMQAAQHAREEEVHFSRDAWLDLLRKPSSCLANAF